jgi:hypothetical protein
MAFKWTDRHPDYYSNSNQILTNIDLLRGSLSLHPALSLSLNLSINLPSTLAVSIASSLYSKRRALATRPEETTSRSPP